MFEKWCVSKKAKLEVSAHVLNFDWFWMAQINSDQELCIRATLCISEAIYVRQGLRSVGSPQGPFTPKYQKPLHGTKTPTRQPGPGPARPGPAARAVLVLI
jgi:hypothetical protein